MATKNRDRKEVQQLIEMGKSKGFLTYDEVNDALPADMVAADQMDDVLGVLGDEDIEIVDAATQVKIAPKRIETGEHTILSAILSSPVAVHEIIDLGDKLRKHKIRVKDIIRDADDENAEFDEEEADRRILRLIDKVKHLDK